MLIFKEHSYVTIKPIFFSQLYLESSIGFCDLCTALVDCEKDLYFTCKICDNFVACLGCIKQKTQQLVSHPSDHHFFPGKPLTNRNWLHRNLDITCNLCGEKHFFGKRYQCYRCSDFTVCSKCLSKAKYNHHPSQQHTFNYIPNPTKIHSNRFILADRAVKILQYRNANPTDRDETTGWSFDEATVICANNRKSLYAAWKRASEILEDEDINLIPSVIENDKIILPSVLFVNN